MSEINKKALDLMDSLKETHFKATHEKPEHYPDRGDIPVDKVSWDVDFSEYNPSFYESEVLETAVWADSKNLSDIEFTKRMSYEGDLGFDENSRPRNPRGRTGIEGRGELGKWGPNHAADPIVTKMEADKLKVLLIKRGDNGQWAIPGGMVDPGEKITATLKRELQEESAAELNFDDAAVLYKGYVDDRRNTDNAWMETVAAHKHLSDEEADMLKLKAGDDAADAQWFELSEDSLARMVENNEIYASHSDLLTQALENYSNNEVSSNREDFNKNLNQVGL